MTPPDIHHEAMTPPDIHHEAMSHNPAPGALRRSRVPVGRLLEEASSQCQLFLLLRDLKSDVLCSFDIFC